MQTPDLALNRLFAAVCNVFWVRTELLRGGPTMKTLISSNRP